MPRIYVHENLVGKKFGRLTVVKELDGRLRNKIGKHPLIMWECLCECGSTKIARGVALRSGKIQSCGCLQKERHRECLTKEPSHVLSTIQFLRYKKNAVQRGHSWDLDFDSFKSIILKPCHYCGSPPSNLVKDSRRILIGKSSGLDRVDSSKGYSLTNVLPCCWVCNKAKGTLSYQDFIEWIDRISKHSKENICHL